MPFASDALFKQIQEEITAEQGAKLKCCYKFILSDGTDKKVWILNAKVSGKPTVAEGAESDAADCTIIMSDSDFMLLASGKLDGMQAMMQKKMQLKGNMMLAQKLGGLFKQSAKL